MAILSVKIGGFEIDFEDIETFPLGINKQTDDLSDIGRSTGAVAANAISRFVIPATKRNCEIIEQAYIPTANTAPALRKYTLTITVGGSSPFVGVCILVDRIINGNYPKQLSFETLGDSSDIWTLLDGLSLRDIPMGSVTFDTSTIVASQSGNADTQPCIFAPVIYGNTSGQPDPGTGNGAMFRSWDFRGHIYYKHIIESVFERYLGYSIESKFFDSEYFKRWVYLYGVGNQWQLDADISKSKFRAELTADYTLPSPGGGGWFKVRFDNVIYDPLAAWNAGTYEWIVPYTGVWEITGGLRWLNVSQWKLLVEDTVQPGPDIYGTWGTYLQVSNISVDQLSFSIALRAGVKVSIEVNPLAPNYQIFAADSFLQIQAKNIIVVGSPLKISSFLHDRPIKDFLRGISHQFNLMWFVNYKIKRVYVEPRFDYDVPDPVFFVMTRYKGWYSSPSKQTAKPLQLNQDAIQLPIWEPYGKFLRLGYASDDDPLQIYYEKRMTESQIPINGIQVDFTERGKNGATELNPYFGNLFLGFSNTVSTSQYALPMVLPNGTDMEEVFTVDSNGAIIGVLPDATFESEPKCGMVYYDKTFVRHEDALGVLGAYALIMQANNLSLNRGYTIFENWSGGYSKSQQFLRVSTQNPSATNNVSLEGLVRYFYYTYLMCINEAVKLVADFSIKNPDVSGENFSGLRSMTINGKNSLWILEKIREFKPSFVELTKCELYLYKDVTEDFVDTIVHNDMAQAPLNHVNIDAI